MNQVNMFIRAVLMSVFLFMAFLTGLVLKLPFWPVVTVAIFVLFAAWNFWKFFNENT